MRDTGPLTQDEKKQINQLTDEECVMIFNYWGKSLAFRSYEAILIDGRYFVDRWTDHMTGQYYNLEEVKPEFFREYIRRSQESGWRMIESVNEAKEFTK